MLILNTPRKYLNTETKCDIREILWEVFSEIQDISKENTGIYYDKI